MRKGTEGFDLKAEIEQALCGGTFLDLGPGSTEDDLHTLFGQGERVVVKKGNKTVEYPDAEFVFEDHRLHQITVKITNEIQAAAVRGLLEKYGSETADELPPYFRCVRLSAGVQARAEVLATMPCTADGIIAVAVVFPAVCTRTVELELPSDVYARLADLSNRTRQTIDRLCIDMIEAGLPEKEKDKH